MAAVNLIVMVVGSLSFQAYLGGRTKRARNGRRSSQTGSSIISKATSQVASFN